MINLNLLLMIILHLYHLIIFTPAMMTKTAKARRKIFVSNLSVRYAPMMPPMAAGIANLPTSSPLAASFITYITVLTTERGSTQATTVAKLSLAAPSLLSGLKAAIANINKTPEPAPRNPLINPAAAPMMIARIIFLFVFFSILICIIFRLCLKNLPQSLYLWNFCGIII